MWACVRSCGYFKVAGVLLLHRAFQAEHICGAAELLSCSRSLSAAALSSASACSMQPRLQCWAFPKQILELPVTLKEVYLPHYVSSADTNPCSAADDQRACLNAVCLLGFQGLALGLETSLLLDFDPLQQPFLKFPSLCFSAVSYDKYWEQHTCA